MNIKVKFFLSKIYHFDSFIQEWEVCRYYSQIFAIVSWDQDVYLQPVV